MKEIDDKRDKILHDLKRIAYALDKLYNDVTNILEFMETLNKEASDGKSNTNTTGCDTSFGSN